jgi:hypothetical protein
VRQSAGTEGFVFPTVLPFSSFNMRDIVLSIFCAEALCNRETLRQVPTFCCIPGILSQRVSSTGFGAVTPSFCWDLDANSNACRPLRVFLLISTITILLQLSRPRITSLLGLCSSIRHWFDKSSPPDAPFARFATPSAFERLFSTERQI